MQAEQRTCQSCKAVFIIEPDDFGFYEKMDVPPPTWCPDCRMQRRFSWYTDIAFYKRPDSRTGEMIFSHFSKDSPVKIYEHDYWWSDAWDPHQYGRDYDFSRPFFEQFQELMRDVPLSSRSTLNLVRSDYSNKAEDIKDCYLVFNATLAERSMYCMRVFSIQDCMDVTMTDKCQLSYSTFGSGYCFRAFWSSLCGECSDIWFSRDCKNCSNCFGCAGLKNKQYYIFNKPFTKEEYFKEIAKFDTGSYSGIARIMAEARKIWDSTPIKYYQGNRTVNSTGQYLWNTKNVKLSCAIDESEQCAYCFNLRAVKDSMDYSTWGSSAERIYDCMECGIQVSDLRFCFDCWPGSNNLTYCVQCHSSHDLFGCIGVRKGEYCILNKKYSKEEYLDLLARIKKHMQETPYVDALGREYRYGEFFPPEMSPHAYHESMAAEYFPLSKEAAIAKGFAWHDPEKIAHAATIKALELPDNIKDVVDSIVNEAIMCAHEEQDSHPFACELGCPAAFRVTPEELKFYRAHKIPLPRLCYRCRYHERMEQHTPLKLWPRKCQCAGAGSENGKYKNTAETHQPHAMAAHCPNEFQTAYETSRPEIIYCEECYQAETA